jgi:hypothetical protein
MTNRALSRLRESVIRERKPFGRPRRHEPMKEQPDLFRDFGILPAGVSPPLESVRCYLPRGHVVSQYFGTFLASCLGIFMAAVFARSFAFPANVLAAAAAIAACGWVVYFATRYDYAWVELEGRTLRAKHLYTRRIIEWSLDEVEDLLTLVWLVRSATTLIAEGLIGRVRGVEMRFRDGRTPIRITRADPAMKHARELIEAIIDRMSEIGEVDTEIINFEGRPLIRRIYWKSAGETNHDDSELA